eukprot:jgi/Bigna1/77470/fgenesh1_pg.48_\
MASVRLSLLGFVFLLLLPLQPRRQVSKSGAGCADRRVGICGRAQGKKARQRLDDMDYDDDDNDGDHARENHIYCDGLTCNNMHVYTKKVFEQIGGRRRRSRHALRRPPLHPQLPLRPLADEAHILSSAQGSDPGRAAVALRQSQPLPVGRGRGNFPHFADAGAAHGGPGDDDVARVLTSMPPGPPPQEEGLAGSLPPDAHLPRSSPQAVGGRLKDAAIYHEMTAQQEGILKECEAWTKGKLEAHNQKMDEYLEFLSAYRDRADEQLKRLEKGSYYAVLKARKEMTDAQLKKCYQMAVIKAHRTRREAARRSNYSSFWFQLVRDAYHAILRERAATKNANEATSSPSSPEQGSSSPQQPFDAKAKRRGDDVNHADHTRGGEARGAPAAAEDKNRNRENEANPEEEGEGDSSKSQGINGTAAMANAATAAPADHETENDSATSSIGNEGTKTEGLTSALQGAEKEDGEQGGSAEPAADDQKGGGDEITGSPTPSQKDPAARADEDTASPPPSPSPSPGNAQTGANSNEGGEGSGSGGTSSNGSLPKQQQQQSGHPVILEIEYVSMHAEMAAHRAEMCIKIARAASEAVSSSHSHPMLWAPGKAAMECSAHCALKMREISEQLTSIEAEASSAAAAVDGPRKLAKVLTVTADASRKAANAAIEAAVTAGILRDKSISLMKSFEKARSQAEQEAKERRARDDEEDEGGEEGGGDGKGGQDKQSQKGEGGEDDDDAKKKASEKKSQDEEIEAQWGWVEKGQRAWFARESTATIASGYGSGKAGGGSKKDMQDSEKLHRLKNQQRLNQLNGELLEIQHKIKTMITCRPEIMSRVSVNEKERLFRLVEEIIGNAMGSVSQAWLDARMDGQKAKNWTATVDAILELVENGTSFSAFAVPRSMEARLLRQAALVDVKALTNILDKQLKPHILTFKPKETSMDDEANLNQKFDNVLRNLANIASQGNGSH